MFLLFHRRSVYVNIDIIVSKLLNNIGPYWDPWGIPLHYVYEDTVLGHKILK